jgi:hypothetical protein
MLFYTVKKPLEAREKQQAAVNRWKNFLKNLAQPSHTIEAQKALEQVANASGILGSWSWPIAVVVVIVVIEEKRNLHLTETPVGRYATF